MYSVRRCAHLMRLLVVTALLAILFGCDRTGYPAYPPPAAAAPAVAPTIAAITPTSVTAGSAGFTLTVTGTGYVSGSMVQWNGSARATTYSSGAELTATIAAADVATAGTAQVTVINPDGQSSGALAFTVTAAPLPAAPTLSSLSPSTATAGSGPFTLTVNGTGFISGATVAWAGSARTTTLVSATQLTATIPASDIANSGTVSVDVGQPGARSSNQLTFTVTAAAPAVVSISPASAMAGSAGFNLTVTGTGFISGASILFNGTQRTTTFVSATQLTATIPSSDLVTPGSVPVDVVQGGVHASSTSSFTITAAAPVISSVNPTSVPAGSPATQLSVAGSGFVASSVVNWNGTALTTSVTSASQLAATVPASSLTSATTASITVVNSAASGGTSNAVSFTVTPVVTGSIIQLVSPDYQTGGISNQTNNQSPPTLSQDGRYVGFVSYSSDLVANDTNGRNDAFLRDTCVGGSAPSGCTPSTTRLSQDYDGTYNNMAYRMAVLSSSGRYVGIDEYNLFAADLIDDCVGATGCSPAISHESYLPGASSTSTVVSCCSVLSPDGRYELFSSLTPNASGGTDSGIFLRDTCAGAAGCAPATTRVVTGTGAQPPHQPFVSDISTGGRYVLFRTMGSDIIPTYSSTLHLFLEDTCLGAAAGCTVTYTPIDVRTDGSEGEGNQANDAAATEPPSLSKDGRYVVFSSTDQQLVAGGTPHVSEVYLRDTCNGAASGCTPSTTLVSADPTALSKDYRSFIGYRSVSEHGRYVAFAQEALDTTTNALVISIRVRDTCIGAGSGCTPSISMASVDATGSFGTAHSSFYFPSISGDGHYVASMNNGNGQVYLSTTGY